MADLIVLPGARSEAVDQRELYRAAVAALEALAATLPFTDPLQPAMLALAGRLAGRVPRVGRGL